MVRTTSAYSTAWRTRFHAGTSRPRARSAASRPASHSRNAGAGSIRTSSGTHITRQRHRPERQQPDQVLLGRHDGAGAGRARRLHEAGGIGAAVAMVVRKRHRPLHLPAGRAQFLEEPLRPRDAGHGQHGRRLPRRCARAVQVEAPRLARRAHEPERRLDTKARGHRAGLLIVPDGTSTAWANDAAERDSRSRPAGSVRASAMSSTLDDEQVGASRQRQVLKAVVEHVHRGIEVKLGQPPGEIAIRRHQHAGALDGAGEHQRFVAAAIEIGAEAASVRHHHDAVRRRPARVPPAENRRPLAHLQQDARDMSNGRRLSRAAHAEVPDADDRPLQPPLPAVALVVPRRAVAAAA